MSEPTPDRPDRIAADTSERLRAQITLKSGAQVEFDITEITTSRSPFDGNSLAGLNWTTPAGWTAKLHEILLDQITAVVVLRDRPKEAGQ